MTSYTAIVQEDDAAIKFLTANNYNLAVAHAVKDGSGSIVSNTIFKSQFLAPSMSVTWTVNYGLNWTANIPTKGAQIEFSGNWQACSLGQAYTLVPGGLWTVNTQDQKPSYLTVRNAYQPVNIVIGIEDPDTGDYTPVMVFSLYDEGVDADEFQIYFSPSQLSAKGLGHWQPQEIAYLWYGFEQNNGYVIAQQATAVERYNMTGAQAQGYKHWFKWLANDSWVDQAQPFKPQNLEDGLLPPLIKYVTFTLAVVSTATLWIDDFKLQMDKRGWSVSVNATTPGGIKWQINAKKRQLSKEEALRDGQDDDLDGAINDSLSTNLSDGDLPSGEKWRITND